MGVYPSRFSTPGGFGSDVNRGMTTGLSEGGLTTMDYFDVLARPGPLLSRARQTDVELLSDNANANTPSPSPSPPGITSGAVAVAGAFDPVAFMRLPLPPLPLPPAAVGPVPATPFDPVAFMRTPVPSVGIAVGVPSHATGVPVPVWEEVKDEFRKAETPPTTCPTAPVRAAERLDVNTIATWAEKRKNTADRLRSTPSPFVQYGADEESMRAAFTQLQQVWGAMFAAKEILLAARCGLLTIADFFTGNEDFVPLPRCANVRESVGQQLMSSWTTTGFAAWCAAMGITMPGVSVQPTTAANALNLLKDNLRNDIESMLVELEVLSSSRVGVVGIESFYEDVAAAASMMLGDKWRTLTSGNTQQLYAELSTVLSQLFPQLGQLQLLLQKDQVSDRAKRMLNDARSKFIGEMRQQVKMSNAMDDETAFFDELNTRLDKVIENVPSAMFADNLLGSLKCMYMEQNTVHKNIGMWEDYIVPVVTYRPQSSTGVREEHRARVVTLLQAAEVRLFDAMVGGLWSKTQTIPGPSPWTRVLVWNALNSSVPGIANSNENTGVRARLRGWSRRVKSALSPHS
jgi:hypothetical protein